MVIPDSGKIFFDNADISGSWQYRERIGYMPQIGRYPENMTIGEVLDMIRDLRKKKEIETDTELVHAFELDTILNKRMRTLSGGTRQKVSASLAFLFHPEVLILDEPTTGLDPNQIVEIRDVIRNYGKDRTVLFSSHILQEVEAICDRVIIINQGKIIADSNLVNLRKEQKGNYIKIILKESVTREAFQGLDQLRAIRKASDYEWELEAVDPELLKKQLLSLSLENNWNIVSLQSENRSLEDIFRGLTKTNTHE